MNLLRDFLVVIWDHLKFILWRGLGSSLSSAFLWSTVWIAVFLLSGIYLFWMGNGDASHIQTTAIALTVAVFSGYAPKFVGYFFGMDSDFRHAVSHFRNKNGKFYDVEKRRVFKFILGLVFIFFAIHFLEIDRDKALENVNITSTTDFLIYSCSFWKTISALFLAQMVFSWPNKDAMEYGSKPYEDNVNIN